MAKKTKSYKFTTTVHVQGKNQTFLPYFYEDTIVATTSKAAEAKFKTNMRNFRKKLQQKSI